MAKTNSKIPSYFSTKKGTISAAGKKWLQKNKLNYTLWLLDGRDDKTQIAVVHNTKKPDSRGEAWEMATWTYQIYSDCGLTDTDYEFISILGRRADVC